MTEVWNQPDRCFPPILSGCLLVPVAQTHTCILGAAVLTGNDGTIMSGQFHSVKYQCGRYWWNPSIHVWVCVMMAWGCCALIGCCLEANHCSFGWKTLTGRTVSSCTWYHVVTLETHGTQTSHMTSYSHVAWNDLSKCCFSPPVVWPTGPGCVCPSGPRTAGRPDQDQDAIQQEQWAEVLWL